MKVFSSSFKLSLRQQRCGGKGTIVAAFFAATGIGWGVQMKTGALMLRLFALASFAHMGHAWSPAARRSAHARGVSGK